MSESDKTDTQSTSAASQAASSEAASQVNNAAVPEATQAKSANEGPSLEEQLAAAKKEASENYNRYLRVTADMENYRKRVIREKDELRQYAATRVLEDLMPALDNLSLGLSAAKQPNADTKTIVGGVEMVLSQLKNALAQHGLKEINPLGQPFDPHQHEAISHMPSAEIPAESVMVVVRTGYSLNGRLLRPASVVVSGGPAQVEASS